MTLPRTSASLARLALLPLLAACGDGGTVGVDDSDVVTDLVDADHDGYLAQVDCDDDDPAIHPGAADETTDGVDQDCDEVDGPHDAAGPDGDGDGYELAVDCDDHDPDIHPGALETADDGVDSNCDGDDAPSSADADGDGYASVAFAGTDCDDDDPAVHPDAADARGDDVDQDCDGADFDAALLLAGDLVITEIMYDPLAVADADGEWFEVVNLTGHVVDLRGLVVADDSAFGATDSFTVAEVLLAAPNARLVFGTNGDPAFNGGIPVDHDYRGRGVNLDNAADDILLGVPNGRSYTVIDAVSYDELGGWPVAKGVSLELKDTAVTATANDAVGNWCLATGVAGTTTDKGSPGKTSSGC